jgi:hypothetical protein
MRVCSRVRKAVLALFAFAVCTAAGSSGQWARQPGDHVRNAFGPTVGLVATACRGACGGGCPSSCSLSVTYERVGADRLRRVRTYTCGTHPACRTHDDCLDRCRERQAQGLDCDAACHEEAVQQYGVENALSWASGGGPYEGAPITFEYTRDSPNGPEPMFRCPAGARVTGTAAAGRCVTASGEDVTPVFDTYVGGAATVHVSDFRSGRVCRDGDVASGVCHEATDIDVTGEARCDEAGTSKPCTWYGFELNYANADPSAPLLCSSGAQEDFLGRVMKDALTKMPVDQSTQLGAALGHLQEQLRQGRSLQDVLSGITITPAGQPAVPKPTPPPPPGVPSSVTLPSASGHLLVPMYEYRDGAAPGSVLVREVRCTLKGTPVLETTFRLHFADRLVEVRAVPEGARVRQTHAAAETTGKRS